MPLEIEHKFLVKNNNWQDNVDKSIKYSQGYLFSNKKRSIRVRVSDNKAWLNIKSATIGTHRHEYEYEIPLDEGIEILNTLCDKPLIEKTRYFVPCGQHTWEIDVFSGDNAGLTVAEIELTTVGENFHKPEWVDKEVTEDIRYYNNSLSKNPYSQWKGTD